MSFITNIFKGQENSQKPKHESKPSEEQSLFDKLNIFKGNTSEIKKDQPEINTGSDKSPNSGGFFSFINNVTDKLRGVNSPIKEEDSKKDNQKEEKGGGFFSNFNIFNKEKPKLQPPQPSSSDDKLITHSPESRRYTLDFITNLFPFGKKDQNVEHTNSKSALKNNKPEKIFEEDGNENGNINAKEQGYINKKLYKEHLRRKQEEEDEKKEKERREAESNSNYLVNFLFGTSAPKEKPKKVPDTSKKHLRPHSIQFSGPNSSQNNLKKVNQEAEMDKKPAYKRDSTISKGDYVSHSRDSIFKSEKYITIYSY